MSNKQKVGTKTPAKTTDPGSSGLTVVVERKEFYRDQYSLMRWLAIAGIASVAVSIAVLFYAISRENVNTYFATDGNGALIKLIPLAEPNQKDSVVANWVDRALVDTFDFNFNNMSRRLNESSMKWFTSEGAAELIKAFTESRTLEAVKEKQLVIALATNHTPLLIKKGLPDPNGPFMWKFEVEGKITYRNLTSVYSNDVIFTVTVARRSLLEESTGLGILKVIMTKK